METSGGASKPIFTLLPLTPTTVIVMPPSMTTFSFGFLLNTSMGFLREWDELSEHRKHQEERLRRIAVHSVGLLSQMSVNGMVLSQV